MSVVEHSVASERVKWEDKPLIGVETHKKLFSSVCIHNKHAIMCLLLLFRSRSRSSLAVRYRKRKNFFFVMNKFSIVPMTKKYSMADEKYHFSECRRSERERKASKWVGGGCYIFHVTRIFNFARLSQGWCDGNFFSFQAEEARQNGGKRKYFRAIFHKMLNEVEVTQ